MIPYDRDSFLVESSRGGVHVVDHEFHTCTCEAFNYTGKCRHLPVIPNPQDRM
jgi:hypothetical protein